MGEFLPALFFKSGYNTMKLTAKVIVFIYLMVSVSYIVLSDRIVLAITSDVEQIASIQLYKGLGFVCFTAILLYFLIKANTSKLNSERQEALRSEKKYRLLFNTTPLPVWVVDGASDTILDVNHAALKIYGYAKEEFLSKKMSDIWVEKIKLNLAQEEKKIGRLVFDQLEIWQHTTKNGDKIWVEMFTHPIEYHDTQATLVLVHNMTAFVQSEKELLASMNELNNFVYRASHDLRGPVARIAGLAELGKVSTQTDEARHFAALAGETADQLDEALRRLLVINSINGKQLEPATFSIMDTVNATTDELSDEMSKAGILLSILGDQNLSATTDPFFVTVALENILKNSIHYKAPSNLRAPFICITFRQVDGNIEIKVTDNGIGIKEEIRDKIFTLFYRGTAESKGSGLGLYLVARALGRIDGQASLGTCTEEETNFIITFPAQST